MVSRQPGKDFGRRVRTTRKGFGLRVPHNEAGFDTNIPQDSYFEVRANALSSFFRRLYPLLAKRDEFEDCFTLHDYFCLSRALFAWLRDPTGIFLPCPAGLG